MESIDPNQAERVWQRVRGQSPEDDGRSLEDLIAGEWEDAAVYLQVSRRVGNREAAILRRLSDEEMRHCTVLRGMYTRITGKKLPLAPGKPLQGSVEEILHRCYARERRCLAFYETRSRDDEYGPVFSLLRDQETEHCFLVLEVLGMLSGRRP